MIRDVPEMGGTGSCAPLDLKLRELMTYDQASGYMMLGKTAHYPDALTDFYAHSFFAGDVFRHWAEIGRRAIVNRSGSRPGWPRH